jgi:hypothetical protein
MKKLVLILMITLFSQSLNAQSIEDGLNMSLPNSIVTPRAGALGVAFHGIADDFSAIAFNPAGLALIDKGEISFGVGFLYNSTQTDFLSNLNDMGTTAAYLSNFGIVAPFKTRLGNASIGIGYYVESNFDNTMEFGALNPYSTYIDYEAKQAYEKGWGLDENFATDLWLADDFYNTPIKNGLYQEALINEKGGLKNISGAMAFELSPFLSIGFAITGKMGTYEYIRDYMETDVNSIYQNEVSERDENDKLIYHDIDFRSVNVIETVEQDISGISCSVGIQGKISNFMRLGLAVKFPTYINISEDFTQSGTSVFDNGDKFSNKYFFTNNYSIITPWVFSGGMSFNFLGLTIATGIEYTDLTQLEFDYSNIDDREFFELKNLQIKQELTGVLKLGAGLEWEVPALPVVLRGSFNYTTPPYSQSFSGEERVTIAMGAGFYLAPNIRMDILGSFSQFKKMWNIYGNSEDTKMFFTRNPYDFGMQLTYRY